MLFPLKDKWDLQHNYREKISLTILLPFYFPSLNHSSVFDELFPTHMDLLLAEERINNSVYWHV